MKSWLMAAEGQQPEGLFGGGGAQLIFMLGAMFLIMYLLVFRPQRRREAERKAMIAAVKRNDRILTSGGIIGIVTAAREGDVTIRVEGDVRLKIDRNFITRVLDKDGEE